jgi:L-alanine-DL-glutamate epimerase-like enolase superfamily enzyme
VVNGKIRVPSDPGLGIVIDPEFVLKHVPVKTGI